MHVRFVSVAAADGLGELGSRAMELRVKRGRPGAAVPRYAHSGDSGLDLCSVESTVIGASEVGPVRTGIAIKLPKGTEAEIRPRSGLARKWAVTVLNSPGTIDEGYRGEIVVLLINHGPGEFRVEKGMRIAQLVVRHRLQLR